LIEIPIVYLNIVLISIFAILNSLWTAFGLYLLMLKATIGGVIVLCIATIFWFIYLTEIEVIIWI